MQRAAMRILAGALMLAAGTGSRATFAQPPDQPAPGQSAAAPSTQAALDVQRFSDLLAVVLGNNSPQARRTAARELLLLGRPETTGRLVAILQGPDPTAKVAVALALAEAPQAFTSAYVDPLLTMLSDSEAEVRRAAAQCLAAGSGDEVIRALGALARSPAQTLTARLAAIEALGMMTQREAAEALVATLSDESAAITGPALEALGRATALDFQGDLQAARAWWEGARGLTTAEWQRMQIQRLVQQSRVREQRLRELEQRLAHALRDNYLRAPEADRPLLLNGLLADASANVRQVGVELAQSQLAEGKPLAPDIAARLRALLSEPEPRLRAAAVRAVAALRDPADAERFLDMLAAERAGPVREALVNGLGYVGTGAAVSPLLAVAAGGDATLAPEAITALGRLAERGVLDAAARPAVVAALSERMAATPSGERVMRERLLWAMSRVADPGFASCFLAALNTPDAPAIRLAAVRGIAVLADPRTARPNGNAAPGATSGPSPATSSAAVDQRELIDALVLVTGDPDPGVRRAAVETLAQLAVGDPHLEALWNRLSSDQEPDEEIRVAAWRGAVRLLARRPLEEVAGWLERLPGDQTTRHQHAVELLQAVEQQLAAGANSRAALGQVRSRLAAEQAALGQIDQALSSYLTALADLHAGQSKELARVAAEAVRLALFSGRYSQEVATALVQSCPGLDGQALWEAIRDDVQRRLQPEQAELAAGMLLALRDYPPASMPADTQRAIDEMLQAALRLREQKPEN